MISVKELSVGDWVSLDGEHYKVTNIGSSSVDTTYGGITSNEHIEPIPLTEDILAKNGFYRSPRWHYCEITIGNFKIYVQLGCGGKIDYVHITSKLSNALARKEIDVTTHINYVHQLQHLLRLCGIEKEFEL